MMPQMMGLSSEIPVSLLSDAFLTMTLHSMTSFECQYLFHCTHNIICRLYLLYVGTIVCMYAGYYVYYTSILFQYTIVRIFIPHGICSSILLPNPLYTHIRTSSTYMYVCSVLVLIQQYLFHCTHILVPTYIYCTQVPLFVCMQVIMYTVLVYYSTYFIPQSICSSILQYTVLVFSSIVLAYALDLFLYVCYGTFVLDSVCYIAQ